jgi:hypothetical protein
MLKWRGFWRGHFENLEMAEGFEGFGSEMLKWRGFLAGLDVLSNGRGGLADGKKTGRRVRKVTQRTKGLGT